LRSLPAEDVAYAGLIGRALLQMGTDKEDFVKLLQRIGRKTGGISHSTLNTITREGREGVGRFMLRGKGTVEQFDDLLDILRDVLLTAKLDNKERFKQIVLENKASYESGLAPSGHAYANTRLKSSFSSADWAIEQIGGVSQLFFLRKLTEQVDKDWDSVQAKLTSVRDALITRHGLVANITIDANNWGKLQPKLQSFINQLPTTNHQPSDWPEGGEAINEGLAIPAQVNYVGKGVDLYALGHQLNGSWFAVQNYLRTVYLWERVRVQGGAYGGFCTFDPRGGGFTYLSYRDPNLLGTLANYDGAAAFLREHTPSEEEVTRTIIGVIGDLDDYMLPDAKGYTSMVRWLANDTDTYRQRVRDEVLGATPKDFVKFAEVLEDVNRYGHVVVIGSPQAIEKANAENGGDWLTVTKVL
jgi:Zn-dependent M16 (insulinase) family peptidase